MYRMRGTGLPNLWLVNGFAVIGAGEAEAVSYEDLAGLYRRIALSIAQRSAPLSGAELRFLRKQIGASQKEVANWLGKTDQALAKWEKGQGAVPRPDGEFVRLCWMSNFEKRAVPKKAAELTSTAEPVPCDYLFERIDEKWQDVSVRLARRNAAVAARITEALVGKVQATWTSSAVQPSQAVLLPSDTGIIESIVL